MPRNMSFFLTTQQMRDRTKTVTRRDGWEFLKPGDVLNAVVKARGLKKGEKVEVIGQIRVLNTRRETLSDVTPYDVIREGFPEMSVEEFRKMFIATHKTWDTTRRITRIEFEHL